VRKILPFVTMLLLAACDVPSQSEKPEIERAALDGDVLQCRHTGQQESLRASQIDLAFYNTPFWGGSWQPTRDLWNCRVEADRARAERQFTAACM
jgi:hypothetical protein